MNKKVTLILELDLGENDSGPGEIVPDVEYWQNAVKDLGVDGDSPLQRK